MPRKKPLPADPLIHSIVQGLAALNYDVPFTGKLESEDWTIIRRFYADKLPERMPPDMRAVSEQQLRDDIHTAMLGQTRPLIDRPHLSPYERKKLQQRLTWLDLYHGAIDGHDGVAMQRAVRLFNAHYPKTGEPLKPVLPAMDTNTVCARETLPKPHATDVPTIVLDAGHGYTHGATYDRGARNRKSGLLEADIVMQEAKTVAEKLRQRGYRVVMTRDDDYCADDPMSERETEGFCDQSSGLKHRVDIARDEAAKGHGVVLVSLHADAAVVERHYKRKHAWHTREVTKPEVHGIRVHSFSKWDKKHGRFNSDEDGQRLASLIAAEFNDQPGTDGDDRRKDNPATVKQSNFQVLRDTHRLDIPAVLVETGFLTNTGDTKRISSAGGRENIAEQLADAIERFVPIAPPFAPCVKPGLEKPTVRR